MSMRDIVPQVTASPLPLAVVNEKGRYLGAVNKTALLKALERAS